MATEHGHFNKALLLLAGALATSLVLLLHPFTWPPSQMGCSAFSSWLNRHLDQPKLSEMPQPKAEVPRLAPAAAAALGGAAADAMRRVGWRSGIQFARFDGGATVEGVLADSGAYSGSLLLIVPGSGTLARREQGMPFLDVDAQVSGSGLSAALAPAVAAMNSMAGAVEAALGRRLFAFRLEAAPLPACASGAGPCAVWEASTGRVLLDAGLAGKIASAAGAAPPAAAAGGKAAAGPGAGGSSATSSGGGGSLGMLLAAFVEKLAEQAAPAVGLIKSGQASLPALASEFARAAPAALMLLMVVQAPPLWWCIACPLVLGMLAPFLFNFGLTAAAEALCAQLHLPDETCVDLWWGAFALALMLSLGSAIPIVYICRLPECGRRAAVAAAAAAGTLAQLAVS